MTDHPQPVTSAPPEDPNAGSTSTASSGGFDPATLVHDRPEVAVGAAFAGGFVFAMILKRLAR